MDKKVLICIGRQSGSGGRKIGHDIADRLGIPCYDKELIQKVAEKSGLAPEVIEHHDEVPSRSFLYSIVMGGQHSIRSGNVELPIEQRIFLAQYNTIRELAEEGSAVFVGRCADYALEDHKNLITIFITADEEDAIAHVESTYGFARPKAKEYVKKTNKRRSNYHDYYTNKEWGDAKNYDLCVNRSRLGFEGTIDLILNFIEARTKAESFGEE